MQGRLRETSLKMRIKDPTRAAKAFSRADVAVVQMGRNGVKIHSVVRIRSLAT